jgi:hypothetical protein
MNNSPWNSLYANECKGITTKAFGLKIKDNDWSMFYIERTSIYIRCEGMKVFFGYYSFCLINSSNHFIFKNVIEVGKFTCRLFT